MAIHTKLYSYGNIPPERLKGIKTKKNHKDSAAKRADVKRTLSRGSIYRQMKRGDLVTKERRKAINRRVIFFYKNNTFYS